MASGRERSESIYTLLHLAFHRCKPVERGKKKKGGGEMRGVVYHTVCFCVHVLNARTGLM